MNRINKMPSAFFILSREKNDGYIESIASVILTDLSVMG
jgi:hypothetical protein